MTRHPAPPPRRSARTTPASPRARAAAWLVAVAVRTASPPRSTRRTAAGAGLAGLLYKLLTAGSASGCCAPCSITSSGCWGSGEEGP
jgi:hypothetical protein